MKRYSLIAGALAFALACDSSQLPEAYTAADTGLALARSSRAKDSLIMLKDSLLGLKERELSFQSALIGDAATSARLVSEIANDLSKARIEVKGEAPKTESGVSTAADELKLVQQKVRVVLDRLSASETRIRRLRSDSVSRTMVNAKQAEQIATYEQSIADLRATVENQAVELAVLTGRVDSLGRANVALLAQNEVLGAENSAMAAHEDSVFVVIGTEKELEEKGIIRKEGGAWFTFGAGKTIVPARSFNRDDFEVLSKQVDLTIELPEPDREYRVVSRQSLEFTSSENLKDPIVKGALQVTDPEKFWAPSKYLILVRR